MLPHEGVSLSKWQFTLEQTPNVGLDVRFTKETPIPPILYLAGTADPFRLSVSVMEPSMCPYEKEELLLWHREQEVRCELAWVW